MWVPSHVAHDETLRGGPDLNTVRCPLAVTTLGFPSSSSDYVLWTLFVWW